MRVCALALGWLLLAAPVVSAGSYTVTTGGGEDTALQAYLDQVENPRRVLRGQNPWTLDELVQHLFNQNLKPIKEAYDVDEVSKACLAYRDLSAQDKDTVKALLGGRSPCR
jgi:hypothetical protein